MTSSSYYNMIPSSLKEEPNDDQDPTTDYHQLFTLKPLQPSSSSSSSSFTGPIFVNKPAQDQERCYYSEFQHPQNRLIRDDQKMVSNGELYPQKEDQYGLSLSLRKKEETSEDQTPTMGRPDSDKWMPSKMRMIRKMMSSEKKEDIKTLNFTSHKQTTPQSSMETETSHYSTSYNNNNNTVRVCADCNTTKTPLWRSGPKGPKSLCNACGIRQRKARRALAAAAAAANGTILPTPSPSKKHNKVQHKDKRSKSNNNGGGKTGTSKKKYKASYEIPASAGSTKKKICFEDFLAISLRKHSACQRVFPQDEKEAAILLMALSCGLVRG